MTWATPEYYGLPRPASAATAPTDETASNPCFATLAATLAAATTDDPKLEYCMSLWFLATMPAVVYSYPDVASTWSMP